MRKAVRPSTTTAETLARWQQQLAGAKTLAEAEKTILASAGWSAERIQATEELVNAYAAADTAQQRAIQTHQQAANEFKHNLILLRKWHSKANQLIKIAIKDQDPSNQGQLRDLLGLD